MTEHEQEYINRAQRGDSAAFGWLYDRYIRQIYRFIVLKVTSKEQAEDLSHEVFLSAWQHLPGYEAKGFPFSSWLYKIARNRIIDYYRTSKATVSIDDAGDALEETLIDTEGESAFDLADLALTTEKVKEAMRQLSPDYYEVLVLRFIEDRSPKEIAELLNKREGTIRIIQHRAILKLKKMLSQPTD